MSRQSTPPQASPPYTNGHYETPLEISGVSLHRPPILQKPTIFPPDLPLLGIRPIFYAIQRFQVGGIAVARFLMLLWVSIGTLAAVGIIPGRWLTIAIAVAFLIAQIALTARLRQQQYVSFTSATFPSLTDLPLEPNEKIAIYATGLLSVEGRFQRYSAVPGFYRTFATGEHALLCRIPERNWLAISSWPLEETGMWYAFVKPSEILELKWGQLSFGTTTLHAIALSYQLEIPPGPRRKRSELRHEILYIATSDQQDAQRIYVDLMNNVPTDQMAKTINSHFDTN